VDVRIIFVGPILSVGIDDLRSYPTGMFFNTNNSCEYHMPMLHPIYQYSIILVYMFSPLGGT